MEGKCNDREIMHCTSVRDSFLSHACPHIVFPFPGNTKEQSPRSTRVPWDPLRAVSWKLAVSWCETAASPPEESQTCACLPVTQLQAALLLAGVGEPGFLCNQEEKVTHEMTESQGSWNRCPNGASISVCPIPQGAGHRIKNVFPQHPDTSALHQALWEQPSLPNSCSQILMSRVNLLSGWIGRVMTAFHYLLGGPNVCA